MLLICDQGLLLALNTLDQRHLFIQWKINMEHMQVDWTREQLQLRRGAALGEHRTEVGLRRRAHELQEKVEKLLDQMLDTGGGLVGNCHRL